MSACPRCLLLEDALQELMDWQNGPPLNTPKYEKGWGDAMEKARAAIHHKRWRLRLVCCGRDDGELLFDTSEEADAARESYTSGPGVNPKGYSAHPTESGHKRAAIKEEDFR